MPQQCICRIGPSSNRATDRVDDDDGDFFYDDVFDDDDVDFDEEKTR